MSEETLWGAVRDGDVRWITEQLRRVEHWPTPRKDRRLECSNAMCGADDCTHCHPTRTARLAEKPRDDEDPYQ